LNNQTGYNINLGLLTPKQGYHLMVNHSTKKIIDLTHEIHTDMPQFIKSRPYAYIETIRHEVGNHLIGSTLCIFVDHIGTHIDAPFHFNPGGKPINEMPLEVMRSTGILLDFSYKEAGTSIKLEEVKDYFKKLNLKPRKGYSVIFYTGAFKKWGSPSYFEHIVEIDPKTVRWLCNNGVMVYGVDAISVDTDFVTYPTHSLLMEIEHYIVENLTNLDTIPNPIFEFLVFPIKLRRATAAPVRAVAIVEDD